VVLLIVEVGLVANEEVVLLIVEVGLIANEEVVLLIVEARYINWTRPVKPNPSIWLGRASQMHQLTHRKQLVFFQLAVFIIDRKSPDEGKTIHESSVVDTSERET
jgi:hypothetical protein